MSRLLAFARELQGASTFEELVAATQAELTAAMGYAHAWLFVADHEDARELRLIDIAGSKRGEVEGVATILKIEGDAMLEEIMRSDAPVVVADARTDPRTDKRIVEHLGNRTIINVPLRLLDKPFGALGTGTFGDEGCRPPTPEQLAYLVGMSNQIVVAAGRIRFLEERRRAEAAARKSEEADRSAKQELEQAAARLRVLAETSHEFAGASGVAELVERTAKRLGEAIGDGCGVRLIAEGGEHLDANVTATYHRDPEVADAFRQLAASAPLRVGEGLTGRIMLSGKALRVDKAAVEPLRAEVVERYRATVTKARFDNLLAVPLAVRGGVIGVIMLARSGADRPYTLDDERLAQDIADRAALAIDNAQRTAELRTANLALRKSEARKSAVMAAALDAIVLMDAQGRIIDFNEAAERTFGFARDEVLGRPLATMLVPPSLRAAHSAGLKRYLATGEATVLGKRMELTAARKDGSEFPAEIAVVQISSEGDPVFTGYIRDITDRRQAAETEALRREKEAVEAANRELEAFSYSVAHDLRAPLRGINGFSAAILEDYTDLDEGAQALLRRVMASAERMGQIIDALLRLARLSRFEVRRELVDLAPIAGAVFEQLRVSEPDRAVEFVAPHRMVAEGDPLLLRVVYENLLENAWKFTRRRQGARIEVGCSSAPEGSHYFVRDNGAGFDMKFADKLFAPFQRLHPADQFEGNGVGLATVQRIVRRHGGQVWASSIVGRGATFEFTLGNDAARAERRRSMPPR